MTNLLKSGSDRVIWIKSVLIVAAIAAQGVDIDRTQIGLEAPITAVGQFDVPVKLHAEVEVTIKVWVVEA